MSKSYVDGIEILSCTSSLYVETGHGIVINIKAKKPKHLELTTRNIKLNIYGKIWDSLPLGIEKIVKWSFLPLNLYPDYLRDKLSLIDGVDLFEMNIFLLTKDQRQIGVLHNTIISNLSKLISKGNPVVEIELMYQDENYKEKPFFSIYTRPSLIKASLENIDSTSIIYNGVIPSNIRDDDNTHKILRWLLYPVLFIVFCWISIHDSRRFTSRLPVLFFTEKLNTSISNFFPPVPLTMSHCWEISRLEFESQQLEISPNTNKERMNEILEIVAKSFGRLSITTEELHGISQAIKEKESQKDLASKVYGFFNFVNLMWILAIFGIIISVGPSIYILLKPLRESVLELMKMIWNQVIIPCHSWGVFELLSYFICVLFITEGFRYRTDTGYYLALTGLFGGIPSLIYSYFLHCPIKPSKNFYIFYYLLSCSFLTPLAIYYQSNLLAWIVIMVVYCCIGFSFMVIGLCYYVGFENEDSMIRVSFSSIILGGSFIGLKIIGLKNYYLDVFQSPTITFSSVLLFLALLIFSSLYYRGYLGILYHYIFKQLIMILAVLICLLLGNVFQIDGLTNTAIVYLVLYLMEKYSELHLECRWNGWILVFLFSIVLYKTALYLHANPDFVISIWKY